MNSVSLSAAQQYQFTKQNLGVDGIKTAKMPMASVGDIKGAGETQSSAMMDGVKEFAQVFDNVEQTTHAMTMGTGDAHSVVEAMATAEVALEAAVTIRNRVVEAYQELLRMPV